MFPSLHNKHNTGSAFYLPLIISVSHSHRVLLVKEVLLVQLVQLACLVDLALRVPRVLLEKREHL